MASSYRNDPRRMTARYGGQCDKCGAPFGKGTDIFWFPTGKRALAGVCADAAERRFRAEVSDEDFMNGGSW